MSFTEKLIYNPETGIFNWKRTGRKAGGLCKFGYRRINIFGKKYYAHLLAWFFTYGEFPKLEVDHINNDKDDNRISNLRLATRNQNCLNTTLSKASTSGYKGVYWHKHSKKWNLQYTFNGKVKSGGYFNSKEEAYQKYNKIIETLNDSEFRKI